MGGYIYRRCSRCQVEKEHNRSAYCKKCSSDYYRQYKFEKLTKPNINISGLQAFVDRVKKNSYLIDFQDISTIIFFYQILTTNIYEYNNLPTGTQIYKMWRRILNYLSKEKKQK